MAKAKTTNEITRADWLKWRIDQLDESAQAFLYGLVEKLYFSGNVPPAYCGAVKPQEGPEE